jgi:hypothetical protein
MGRGFLLTAAFFTLFGAQGFAPVKELTAAEQLASLDWLAGTWRQEGFESHYTSPEGGMILSTSKSYSQGRVVFFEFERIEIQEDSVVYVPYPAGKASVSFKLVDYQPEKPRIRFENKEHDFPKDLTFELISGDHLRIFLTGVEKGKYRTLEFNLRRKE